MSAVLVAGMPTVTLNDAAAMRVQTISFFLLCFLLSSLLIQVVWNVLSKALGLPRLSYPKALGVVTLWGLLFVLVLTMISGARELMTPGAWEKQGATYRLEGTPPPDEAPPGPTLRERENKLMRLRAALWNYARAHGGKFPPDANVSDIPPDRWELPGAARVRYVYVGGLVADQGARPLAYEPDLGRPSLALLSNGEVREMLLDEILEARAGGKR
jgi:hypothetical protein